MQILGRILPVHIPFHRNHNPGRPILNHVSVRKFVDKELTGDRLEEFKSEKDPSLSKPSDALVYWEARERKQGRTYKSNSNAVKSKIDKIKKMLTAGNIAEANAIAASGRSRSRNWLVGRKGKRLVILIQLQTCFLQCSRNSEKLILD